MSEQEKCEKHAVKDRVYTITPAPYPCTPCENERLRAEVASLAAERDALKADLKEIDAVLSWERIPEDLRSKRVARMFNQLEERAESAEAERDAQTEIIAVRDDQIADRQACIDSAVQRAESAEAERDALNDVNEAVKRAAMAFHQQAKSIDAELAALRVQHAAEVHYRQEAEAERDRLRELLAKVEAGQLTEEGWAKLQELINAPARDLPKLRALLTRKP